MHHPAPKPRRSVLYVPADKGRALAKLSRLEADCFILDLEDAVAPETKAHARQQVLEALAAPWPDSRERVVRINSIETPWASEDLAAMARSGADAILLPKVDSPEVVTHTIALLDHLGAPADLPIWSMLETPLGVLRAEAIACASERVEVLVMGTSDLGQQLRAQDVPGREPLLTALGLCLLAARAHGRVILDGVHVDLEDDQGFAAACRQGAQMGFDGKTLIHPKTILRANAEFSPSRQALDHAHRVIDAHTQALEAGRGVAVVDGRLVESLHVAEAQRLITLSEEISALNNR